MTELKDTHSTEACDAQLKKDNRRKIIRFVSVFAVTTLTLLIVYRYSIATRANDWYLYTAANHTAFVLDKIGHAELEPLHYSNYEPKKMRASMSAWEEGRDTPTEEELKAASPEPLTPWERWSYRAIESRRSDKKRVNGPRVYFVLREGIGTQIDSLQGEINALLADPDQDLDKKKEEETKLRQEITTLRTELQTLRAQGDGKRKDSSLIFPFILVPECGAIEIMAIFLAAVLAFPTLWRKRLIGLVVGLPAMYGVNIFRLTILAIIGALDTKRQWFNFAHEYVWQAIYIIFVVVVWLLWAEYIVNRERPAGRSQAWGLPAFCLKFLVAVIALVMLWWWLLPYYGYVLLQATGIPLRYLFGMAIEAGRVEASGLMRTGTQLIYTIAGHERSMHIALLATNVPPYAALILATAGLGWLRRIRILLQGVGILCLFHMLFIIVALRFQDDLLKVSEIPSAIILFFLTLPFMLWIVFAYWDRIRSLGRGKDNDASEGSDTVQPK